MKKIAKKLRGRGGMTLAEMLAAVAVFSVLMAAIGTGTAAALKVYRQSTDLSEAAVLASTLSEAVMDELRYAVDPGNALDAAEESHAVFTSRTYGKNVSFVSNWVDGRVYIGPLADGTKQSPLLGSKAYQHGLKASVHAEYGGGVYTVTIAVSGGKSAALQEREFTVRPVNQ
ncbi:MAG: prepilin-type N-terminal cleavage/methylation domain-containing protein [Eubacteriales bacterium]|nr:prepilin-type N-terminal cleavage/methylation domain-containing protein [Eubacteriales bacterium]